jgi:hypothetical protein
MTAPSRVEWTPDALEAWRRLPLADAAEMARAVQRFADVGEGVVIYSDGAFLLFVGRRVAELLVDGAGTVYVVGLRLA